MTTISNISSDSRLSVFIRALVLLVAASFLVVLYLYNQNVNLRHEIDSQSKILHHAAAINTELNDDLYKLTDAVVLKNLAGERNLIEDKNPNYFKKGTLLWVVAH